jgi:hypothetical protein
MMKEIRFFGVTLIWLFVTAACLHAACQPVVRAEDNGLLGQNGKPLGPAVISSDTVSVPELQFRFIDEKNAVQPKQITVSYNWKWWKYPYPEHAWGAWSDSFDFVKCTVETNSPVTVPEYTATPKGWYKGKYTNFPWSHKPKFNQVHVHVTATACDSKFDIEQSEFERYQGKIAVVELVCSQRPKISFSDK